MDLEISSEVSQMEKQLFPEESLNEIFRVQGLRRPMTSFSPSSQFKMGIYDSEVIANLQLNSSVLEIGVGKGTLSQILVEGFKIPAKNITVSDINLENFVYKNTCTEVTFDMLDKWPETLQKYNYITFPSSFGVATGWAIFLENYSPINDCIEFATSISRKLIEGKSNVSDENLEKFLKLAEHDAKNVLEKASFVLTQASAHLKESGQIRITKHGLNTFHQASLLHNLRKKKINFKQIKASEDLLVLELI